VTQAQVPADPAQRLLGNRYAVLGEIGRGGMGVVWRAEDRVIGRLVAIKELHLPDSIPPAERGVYEERLLREARTAGRLNDPAVVTVYDVIAEQGVTYIVMELVEAVTLSEVIKTNGPLPMPYVASLGLQVLSALQAAHAAGIVHRDVKPSNLLVRPDGKVKLTDFGIAQAADDPRLTTSGMIVGSPTYMAPERITDGSATPASDLWSLGATLFYAVEGRGPFERNTTVATLHAIMNEVPYLTLGQGPVASAIMGLLISNPEARHTATQTRHLLDVAAGQGSTGAHQGITQTALTQQAHQRGTTYAFNGPPQQSGPHYVVPRRKVPWWLTLGVVAVVLLGGFAGGYFVHQAVVDDGSPYPADGARVKPRTYGTDGDVTLRGAYDGYCGITPFLASKTMDVTGDCKTPHDLQVIAQVQTIKDPSATGADPVAYPGREALEAAADTVCGLVFASDLVTAANKDTTMKYSALVPSKSSWESDGSSDPEKRSVYCVVWNKDGSPRTDSVVRER
jgi:hypothetical protein